MVVFDGLGDLTDYLAAAAADPEARVVRVKNRLDPSHDPADTAGYR